MAAPMMRIEQTKAKLLSPALPSRVEMGGTLRELLRRPRDLRAAGLPTEGVTGSLAGSQGSLGRWNAPPPR